MRPEPPSIAEQRRVIREHFDECKAYYGSPVAARLMLKFGIKYAEHHPHPKKVRTAIVACKTSDALLAVIDEWYSPDLPPVRRRKDHGDLVAAGAVQTR